MVMSVIKNMWSFGILLSFMFIGFGLIFNIFTTDSATELRMNFMSGFLSLYGPQIPEESSQSEKIVYSIAAIVLTTILSNLLVTIMSKAHEALFENKTLTDSKEKLDLILESMVYHHTRLLPKCLGKCRNRSSKKNAYKGQIYNTKPKKGCCSKKKKREAFIKEPSYLIIAENDQLK